MSEVKKIKAGKGELEWTTIDGEGKENMSGKMQYVTNLVAEEDDDLVDEINAFWEANKPKGFKKEPKSNGIYRHKTKTDEKDEDGKAIFEEDGKIYFAFKTGTSFPDGSTKKVQVYNAKGTKVELPEGTKIGNGSVGIVAGAMGIYENRTKQGKLVDAGVTLYLDAIQIFKLEEFSQDAGFEADEEAEGWTGESEGTFEGDTADESNASTTSKPRL